MKLIKNYPIRTTLGTIAVVTMFLVGTTRVLTQDRDAAYQGIAENKAANSRIEHSQVALAKEICELTDEIEDLRIAMQNEDKKLWAKNHATEISLTEIKTKLTGVEALLVKIDRKLP